MLYFVYKINSKTKHKADYRRCRNTTFQLFIYRFELKIVFNTTAQKTVLQSLECCSEKRIKMKRFHVSQCL